MVQLTPTEKQFLSRYLKEPEEEALTNRLHKFVQKHDPASKDLTWLQPQISLHRAYKDLRDSFQNDFPPKVANLNCGFGSDVRQLVLDGLPSGNILVIDNTRERWDAGLDFYGGEDELRVKSVFGEDELLEEFKERYDAVYVSSIEGEKADEMKRMGARAIGLLAPGGLFFGTVVGCESDGIQAALKGAAFEDITVEKFEPSGTSRGNHSGAERSWSFAAKKNLPEWSSC